MEITRNKHFKAYLESLYIKMAARHLGLDGSAARIKFEDEYMEDVNMITFVINSTFPNTKPVGDVYHFITKDEFIHTDIKTGQAYPCGAFTFYIDDNLREILSFDNKLFHHGQVNEYGRVICWGGFEQHSIGEMFVQIGLSGMLMGMYNFARVSNHDTRMLSK